MQNYYPTAKAAGQNFFMQLENIRISTKTIVSNYYWPTALAVGYKKMTKAMLNLELLKQLLTF